MPVASAQDFKMHSLEDALTQSIPVREDIHLVPVGPWILEDLNLISLMCKWRTDHKESFFAQIEPDADSMLLYLDSVSITNDQNLLFIVFAAGKPVGHLGLGKISGTSASLDQVMKAVPGGLELKHKGLMECAIRALAGWSKSILGVTTLNLEVLSSNFAALKLYENCKFGLVKRTPLTATVTKDGIQLLESAVTTNPGLYKCVMRLEL